MASPRSRSLLSFSIAWALFALPSPAAAQRGSPEHEWAGKAVVLDHGKPSFGRHSLDELPPGQRWRLGSNQATTLRVGAPLLGGGAMIAPGHYRVQLYRDERDGNRFFLQIDGAGWALGSERQVEYLPGTISDVAHQKKMQVRWVPLVDGQSPREEKTDLELRLEVRFGPHQVDVPMTMLGSREVGKVGRYTLTSYTVDAKVLEKRLEAGRPAVVATLAPRKKVSGRKAPPFFNLVLDRTHARLVPAQRAPVDSFGFAELEAYDEAWTTAAEIEWIDKDEAVEVFEVSEANATKDRLDLTCMFGRKLAAVSIELPSKPKR